MSGASSRSPSWSSGDARSRRSTRPGCTRAPSRCSRTGSWRAARRRCWRPTSMPRAPRPGIAARACTTRDRLRELFIALDAERLPSTRMPSATAPCARRSTRSRPRGSPTGLATVGTRSPTSSSSIRPTCPGSGPSGSSPTASPIGPPRTSTSRSSRRPFVGDLRTDRMYPFGSLARQGAPLAMGSDWSVTTADPLHILHVALQRTSPEHPGARPLGPAERLSPEVALRAYTRGSALANGLDDDGYHRARTCGGPRRAGPRSARGSGSVVRRGARGADDGRWPRRVGGPEAGRMTAATAPCPSHAGCRAPGAAGSAACSPVALVAGIRAAPAAAGSRSTWPRRAICGSSTRVSRRSSPTPGRTGSRVSRLRSSTADGLWTGVAGKASVRPERGVRPRPPSRPPASPRRSWPPWCCCWWRTASCRCRGSSRAGCPTSQRVEHHGAPSAVPHERHPRPVRRHPQTSAIVERHKASLHVPRDRPTHRTAPGAPGTRYDYSNANYILLGRIVERVTGKGIATVIRSRLLRPLDLDHTWFQGEEPAPTGMATRRHGLRPAWRGLGCVRERHGPPPWTSMATFIWAAGAMMSTPTDLARWARALYGGQVLRRPR